jgi:hypothetical protein
MCALGVSLPLYPPPLPCTTNITKLMLIASENPPDTEIVSGKDSIPGLPLLTPAKFRNADNSGESNTVLETPRPSSGAVMVWCGDTGPSGNTSSAESTYMLSLHLRSSHGLYVDPVEETHWDQSTITSWRRLQGWDLILELCKPINFPSNGCRQINQSWKLTSTCGRG